MSVITEYKLEMYRNRILKKGKSRNKNLPRQNILLIIMCSTGNHEGFFFPFKDINRKI